MDKSIPCELCTMNIIRGTVYKAKLCGFVNPVIICESCRRAILNAEKVYHDGRKDE